MSDPAGSDLARLLKQILIEVRTLRGEVRDQRAVLISGLDATRRLDERMSRIEKAIGSGMGGRAVGAPPH